MDDIYRDVIRIIEKHSNNQGGVVCEIGDTDSNYNYVYVDIGLGLGKRQSIDNAKVVFMNECMTVLEKLQRFIESPIETSECSSFVCQPGCSCGTWGDETMMLDDIQ